jgi:hypothetical protein
MDDGGKNDAKGSDAWQPNTCLPSMVSESKGQGESCACDQECRTGFCVDHYCCDTPCQETCKACNLRSSLGTCAFVPSRLNPTDPSECPASTQATCGPDGTCDGRGGCSPYYEKGKLCQAGTCQGDGVTGILTCDGNGKCSEETSKTCPTFTCDPATFDCGFACTTNAQCAAGKDCVAGSCGKSLNSAPCKTDDGCYSGHCAPASVGSSLPAGYGVCCNTACTDACQSCDQTGSMGICTYIPKNWTDDRCTANESTLCGNNGACDGFGSCTLSPENTPCGSSSCSGLVENTTRTCDGKGNCQDPGRLPCYPFICSNGACLKNCTGDTDCAPPDNSCQLQTTDGGTAGLWCGPRGQGQSCSASSECASGPCVDGVCCENSCTGPCQSCNLPSSPGQCKNVAADAPDPHKICADLGAAFCSTNGLCDGNGACQVYQPGTNCVPQSCVAGVYAPPSTCNASGQCVPSNSILCYPYVCNVDTCFESCTAAGTQCAADRFCENSLCGTAPNGAKCSVATQCQSGFCAQGVCCANACTDACMACNLTTTLGLCVAVADKASDPQRKCAVTQSTTCGTTGTCVKGACAYWSSNCGAASCASTSSVTRASTCDGAGSCVSGAVVACTNQTCVSGACQGVCAPGQLRCSGNGVQTCTATGTWGAAVACLSQACLAGACTGSCSPGSTQCSGNSVQACGSNGTWGTAVDCVNKACVSGACQGVCAPDSTQCSGNGVQTCGSTGAWGTAADCGNKACVSNACQGVCAPGSTQCWGNGVQTCSSTGTWGTAVACPNQACVSGACQGVCAPGSTQCSGTGVQTCSSTGTWGTAVACPNLACVSGACTDCSPTSKRCSSDGTGVQTCNSAGAWGTAVACSSLTCLSGACTACKPGSTQCSSDGTGLQTCSTTGTWGTAVACSSLTCLSGACTTCKPGSTQCSSDGIGLQTCSTTGTWGTAVA